MSFVRSLGADGFKDFLQIIDELESVGAEKD